MQDPYYKNQLKLNQMNWDNNYFKEVLFSNLNQQRSVKNIQQRSSNTSHIPKSLNRNISLDQLRPTGEEFNQIATRKAASLIYFNLKWGGLPPQEKKIIYQNN